MHLVVSKRLIWIAALAVVLFPMYYVTIGVPIHKWRLVAPWKVTVPTDPRFDPTQFQFDDYPIGAMRDVFPILFPVGTPKALVDEVLVEAAGAKAYQSNNYRHLWYYVEPEQGGRYFPKGPAGHLFTFDDSGRLLNIKPNGGSKLYPDQPDYRELATQEQSDGKQHNR